MAWVFFATKASSVIGIDGKAYWARPESSFPLSTFNEIPIPGAVGFRAERTCANLYQGDLYTVGGLSHNMRLTRHFGFVIQGILPPQNEIVNAAGSGLKVGVQASGTGLTANIIPYISLWDSVTNERSPLSEAGPTIALTNQGLAWSNLPTSQDEEIYKIPGDTTANASLTVTGTGTFWTNFVRIGDEISLSSAPTTFSKVKSVTNTVITVATALGNGSTQQITVKRQPRWSHVELWRSVDGSLPRLVARVPRGVSSFSESVAAGDLGEAFTESFTRFPRGKYSIIWHDRQVISGDEENPSLIYLSLIGLPERRSDVTLETRNGETVVGLGVVRDTLLVFCQTATYIVSGYTSDDIQINMIQPNLGLVSHFAQANIHGYLWLATNLGPYMSDGSSWFPMNKRLKDNWVFDYRTRTADYEDCFAVHDPIRHVIKFYLGTHPNTNAASYSEVTQYTYLVADYTAVVPVEGGQMAQPRWSFDTYLRAHDTAFQLALPGGRRSDLFVGACNGFFYRENHANSVDDGGLNRSFTAIHPADFATDHGGNAAHGKTFRDLDLFIQNEDQAFTMQLYPGDEYAWPVDLVTIPALTYNQSFSAQLNGDFAPNAVHTSRLEGITGRALTIAIKQNPCGDLRYRGYQFSWIPGPASRWPIAGPSK